MGMSGGIWYSICWEPKDFANPNSFIELDGCPRFFYSEDFRVSTFLRSKLEDEYTHLYVKEIFKTEIFVENASGEKMPTHYRKGIFGPGQNHAYDSWLKKSFSINQDILEKMKIKEQLFQKKVYLEYSNKIIRHDMHSGINTYIPRGLKMLQKKLSPELIKQLKLAPALKLLENGLAHTQMVYKGVYAFTSLTKEQGQLPTELFDLNERLDYYLKLTAYSHQVELKNLPKLNGNESLFCTAIDNLIRNGLKYNDSKQKKISVFFDGDSVIVEDNGVGMTHEEFEYYCLPYKRKESNYDTGSGLGLNIAVAILQEHDCNIRVQKLENGTRIHVDVLHMLEGNK
jgi:hypothetical protein